MKKVLSLLLSFILLFMLSLTAFSAKSRIVDNAQLLSSEERTELEALLKEKRKEDKFDIVILTEHYVDDLESCADDYYDYNGYGVGEDKDGLLLLVTEDGCWLSTTGLGIDAVDPYLSDLSESFHYDIESDGYFYAFEQFVLSVSEIVRYERDLFENGYGDETDDYEDEYPFEDGDFYFDSDYYDYFPSDSGGFYLPDIIRFIIIPLAFGLIFALIVTTVMKNKLKSVRMKNEANDCIRPGSMRVTKSSDNFLYNTVSRVQRPRDEDHHHTGSTGVHHAAGGSGSTHVGSSGTTHGGGAF